MSNIHVVDVRKCQIWGQEGILIQIRLARAVFLTSCHLWHVSQDHQEMSLYLQRGIMWYFMMWAMEVMGMKVFVTSLDQPLVVGTATDGLCCPTWSHGPTWSHCPVSDFVPDLRDVVSSLSKFPARHADLVFLLMVQRRAAPYFSLAAILLGFAPQVSSGLGHFPALGLWHVTGSD